jgi:hypothetical protein
MVSRRGGWAAAGQQVRSWPPLPCPSSKLPCCLLHTCHHAAVHSRLLSRFACYFLPTWKCRRPSSPPPPPRARRSADGGDASPPRRPPRLPPGFPQPGASPCLAAACLFFEGLPRDLEERELRAECAKHCKVRRLLGSSPGWHAGSACGGPASRPNKPLLSQPSGSRPSAAPLPSGWGAHPALLIPLLCCRLPPPTTTHTHTLPSELAGRVRGAAPGTVGLRLRLFQIRAVGSPLHCPRIMCTPRFNACRPSLCARRWKLCTGLGSALRSAPRALSSFASLSGWRPVTQLAGHCLARAVAASLLPRICRVVAHHVPCTQGRLSLLRSHVRGAAVARPRRPPAAQLCGRAGLPSWRAAAAAGASGGGLGAGRGGG